MTPGQYTELFFLDEAVALSAGHRPCAERRNEDYRRFLDCWAAGNGTARPNAATLDRALHRGRVEQQSRMQITHRTPSGGLPDGVFVRHEGSAAPLLLLGDAACPFQHDRYGTAVARPRHDSIEVLTPAPTVAALHAGYAATIHPSAGS